MPVTIVTDSSCDLPPELVQQGDIRIVPCSVSFGDQTYRDGVDINREQFYEMLTGGTVFPRPPNLRYPSSRSSSRPCVRRAGRS